WAAHAALTRPHAGTKKCLDLVRPRAAFGHGLPNLGGRHFLAAADHDRTGRHQNLLARTVQEIQERPDSKVGAARPILLPELPVTGGVVDPPQLMQDGERRDPSCMLRSPGSLDSCGIAGN